MKRVIILIFVSGILLNGFSQDSHKPKDYEAKGFSNQRLFVGGSGTLSFYTGGSSFGINPYFGYQLTSWADVALLFNVNYQTQRDYYLSGDKLHQTVYGPGAFLRLYPLNFLFAQVQYEHNFIHQKYFPPTSSGYVQQTSSDDANSILLGGGYAGGRRRDSNTFYFFSVLFDVLALPNSPYVDNYGRATPIIKAGYNIGLGNSDRKPRRRREY